MKRRALRSALAAILVWSSGCSSHGDGSLPKPTSSTPAPAESPSSAPSPPRILLDLVQLLPSCDLDHRGPFLDADTDSLLARIGWARGLSSGVSPIEHEGSTWARISERKLTLTFSMMEASPIFVSARAQGIAAKAASVLLDDQPLGTLNFQRDQIRIATTTTTTLPLDPGPHTLSLRFSGRARSGEAFADFDWIRVGVPDDIGTTFGAPTQRDIIAPKAALAGVPHRSIALRTPSSVRCVMRAPPGAHLRVAVGVQGSGDGEAEIRALRDGKKPEVLRSLLIEAAEKPSWTDIDVPLEPLGSGVGALELRALRSPPGGRVLFGDPVVILPAGNASPPPPARAAVIVVLDGVERPELPPWSPGPTPALPTFAELVTSATVFDLHRAPSTVVAASVASLLTGLTPPNHGLADLGARLPSAVVTLATVARDASVRTAMFTGVPTTFRAFGFDRAWEKFVELPPQGGASATAPIDEATSFITDLAKNSPDARMLVVIHARGGHPPWDVTAKELATAEPPDYGGVIDPRTSAQKIARMRRTKRARIATDADRIRIRALEAIGLAGQDRALGALVAALRTANLWESTLFVVTGDVASGHSDLFGDGLPLKEPLLTLPLYIHFPGSIAAGRRMGDPTEIVDLAATSLGALGLGLPGKPPGRDLGRLVTGLASTHGGPQIATLDTQYAARWGDLVLSGKYPAPPRLCDLALDPTCAFDRRETMPIAASAIFRRIVVADLESRATATKREPATIDPDTGAALNVWGASE